MTKAKDLIKSEHKAVGGKWDDACRVKKITGADSNGSSSYFLYWQDGQILHRDTYEIKDGKVMLFMAEKRYHDTTRYILEQ